METWGDSSNGGNSTGVDLSSGVQEIFSTSSAFAALKTDGSVLTWGSSLGGGDSSSVSLSSDVTNIIGFYDVFIAFKSTNKSVIWGDVSSNLNESISFKNHFSGFVDQVYLFGETLVVIKKDSSLYSIGSNRSIAPDLRGAN